MSCNFGEKIRIQIFGQSHSEMLGVVIDGLPAGFEPDIDAVHAFLMRRQGGKSFSTPRKEEDLPHIVSGLVDGKTCGAPLCALFANKNIKSKDYAQMADIPRPSHADYVAHVKYNGANDVRGGGHFSGRMTLALCFAGALCMQILNDKGIYIGAHIASIGSVEDEMFSPTNVDFSAVDAEFPTLDSTKKQKMINEIAMYAKEYDSIGGSIECAVTGLPVGIGEPMFDGLENQIAKVVFAVPAIRGIEFGAGFAAAQMPGSVHNDAYYYENDVVKVKNNHAGGVLGGISTGMPLIFKVAVKPTPSIFKEQESISLSHKKGATLAIKGRHDPCIVPRAVPCIEAAAALAVINLL